jgi:hypothetical protein
LSQSATSRRQLRRRHKGTKARSLEPILQSDQQRSCLSSSPFRKNVVSSSGRAVVRLGLFTIDDQQAAMRLLRPLTRADGSFAGRHKGTKARSIVLLLRLR